MYKLNISKYQVSYQPIYGTQYTANTKYQFQIWISRQYEFSLIFLSVKIPVIQIYITRSDHY